MREFIIQYNDGDLDLFEYTNEKEIVLLKRRTFILDIIDIISQNNDCFVWIEYAPQYFTIKKVLNNLQIECGTNNDAELWMKYIWKRNLPQMRYISYWNINKPITLEEYGRLLKEDDFRFYQTK